MVGPMPRSARDPDEAIPPTASSDQCDHRSDRGEPEAVRDPAEMVQLTLRQSAFGNIDAEEICDRQAAPQRRRPDRDGCEQQHDGQRQSDIGDQAPHHDCDPGQEIAEAGRDQIVGIIPDMSDRRRIADLAGGRRSPGRPLAEHKTPCHRHGRAERGADVAAARDGRKIIDPSEQIMVVQRLKHAKTHRRGADAAAREGEPDDVEHLARFCAVRIDLPRTSRRVLIASISSRTICWCFSHQGVSSLARASAACRAHRWRSCP